MMTDRSLQVELTCYALSCLNLQLNEKKPYFVNNLQAAQTLGCYETTKSNYNTMIGIKFILINQTSCILSEQNIND